MYKTALSISLLLLPILLRAESADDYFHGAAQDYVWGKNRDAISNVVTGLRLYPQDPKLGAIAGLLKQQEEQKQQKQQQQQNQQNQDQQKDQQQQQQQPQAQQKQSERNQNEQKQQQAEQQKQEQQNSQAAQQPKPKEDQQKQAAAQPKDKADEKDQSQAKADPQGQMTPQEAKQLLDAQKGDEQMLPPEKPNQKPLDRNHPIRDW